MAWPGARRLFTDRQEPVPHGLAAARGSGRGVRLSSTLPGRRAVETARWANLLLDGDLLQARAAAATLVRDGFVVYASRDFESLRRYVRQPCATEPARRYGALVVSSLANSPLRASGLSGTSAGIAASDEGGLSHHRSLCRLDTAVLASRAKSRAHPAGMAQAKRARRQAWLNRTMLGPA